MLTFTPVLHRGLAATCCVYKCWRNCGLADRVLAPTGLSLRPRPPHCLQMRLASLQDMKTASGVEVQPQPDVLTGVSQQQMQPQLIAAQHGPHNSSQHSPHQAAAAPQIALSQGEGNQLMVMQKPGVAPQLQIGHSPSYGQLGATSAYESAVPGQSQISRDQPQAAQSCAHSDIAIASPPQSVQSVTYRANYASSSVSYQSPQVLQASKSALQHASSSTQQSSGQIVTHGITQHRQSSMYQHLTAADGRPDIFATGGQNQGSRAGQQPYAVHAVQQSQMAEYSESRSGDGQRTDSQTVTTSSSHSEFSFRSSGSNAPAPGSGELCFFMIPNMTSFSMTCCMWVMASASMPAKHGACTWVPQLVNVSFDGRCAAHQTCSFCNTLKHETPCSAALLRLGRMEDIFFMATSCLHSVFQCRC